MLNLQFQTTDCLSDFEYLKEMNNFYFIQND